MVNNVTTSTRPTTGDPGWPFWPIALLAAPALAFGVLYLALFALEHLHVGLSLDGNDLFAAYVLLSGVLGALVPWVLPRGRSMRRTTRRCWSQGGALLAVLGAFPVGFAFFVGLLLLFCHGGCLS
jgi:hypothetical protein